MKKITLILFVSLLVTFARVYCQGTRNPVRKVTAGTGDLSIVLLLNNSGGSQNTADGARALFDDSYSAGIGREDSYKFTNQDETLAINRNGNILSIEGRPTITSFDTLPLRIIQYRQTSYFFKMEGSGFARNLSAELKDAFMNSRTPIDPNSTTLIPIAVDTNSTSSASPNRFSILFRTVSMPVSIAVSPADATACNNGNAHFTVTATGFYLAYQWQVSADGGVNYTNTTDGVLYTGSTTATLTITGAVAAMNGYLYRAVVSGASPVSSATSQAGRLSIADTWSGSAGHAFSNAANWVCNMVPSLTDNVVVPGSAANMPELTGNAAVASLNMQTGSLLALNGQTFTINGDVSGNGVLTGSTASGLIIGGTGGSGTVYFDPGNDTTTNALQNLTVNRFGNIAIGNKLYLTGVLSVLQGTLNTNDNLVLRSTSQYGTARVANVTGSIAGNVTVERFMDAVRSYRLAAPAVQTNETIQAAWMEGQHNTGAANNNNKPGFGTHITGPGGGTNGFDQTATNNPSLYTFNESTQKYEIPANTTTTGALVNGKGYRLFIRGDRSINLATNTPIPTTTILRATGTLRTGDVAFNATSAPALSNQPGATPEEKKGYSLIGNPYASPVSWSSLAKSNVSTTYFAYDPQQSTRGAYVSYNSATGYNSNFSSEVNDNLQSGQAFFVQTIGGNPSLVFHEADKTEDNTNVFRTFNAVTTLSVRLLLNTNPGKQNTADGTIVLFDSAYLKGLGDEDSYKLNNPDENIAVVHDTTNLSIEGRSNVAVGDTIALKIWQYRQKSYFLRLDAGNFATGTTAVVKDAYLHAETPVNLNDSTLIPFSLTADSASFASGRFMIIFKHNTTLPVNITDIRAYTKDKGVQISWTARSETNTSRYEVERSANARQFIKAGSIAAKGNSGVTENYEWFDGNPLQSDNYYRLKVIEKSGVTTYTSVVKVAVLKAEETLSIFPNPVKGRVINFQLTNAEKGTYTLALFNGAGQKIFAGTMEHDGSSIEKTVKLAAILSKGTYTLQLVKSDHKLSKTVVVQ